MKIDRFKLDTSEPGHNGTIRTQKVIPDDWVKPPFDTAWGYLSGPGEMEGHEHAIEEVYMFFKGEGLVVVGDEEKEVSAGDIVEIPVNTFHTVKNMTEEELLWAAIWWEKK
jgi:mannose-6-phosphate isomerase-like protein (cupin superfamily)